MSLNKMSLNASLSLTRPRQWPILTAQLIVGILLSYSLQNPQPGFVNLGEYISWTPLVGGWFAWVVLLNGGTLAFNSAFDRDTGPVAYLNNPPTPPLHLEKIMFGAMALGVLTGWIFVGFGFGLTVAACLILSVLYSHPLTRWKGIPGLDLFINIIGYGAGTTLGGLLIGTAMMPSAFPSTGLLFILGFGLLFGSLYPLTQIYQVREDRMRGDRTLASAMGIRPVLAVAFVLGIGASITLMAGVMQKGSRPLPIYLLGGLSIWQIHLVWWWLRTESMSDAQHEKGMYHALWIWALVDITLLTEMLLR